jgi:hypothetical protein
MLPGSYLSLRAKHLSLVLVGSTSFLSVRRSFESSMRDVYLPKCDLVRHIPEWLPWFSYQPLARFGHDLAEKVKHHPMQFVRESMVCTADSSSIAAELTIHPVAQWHCAALHGI